MKMLVLNKSKIFKFCAMLILTIIAIELYKFLPLQNDTSYKPSFYLAILFETLIFIPVIYTVLNIEKVYKLYKIGFNKNSILHSLFFSLLAILFITPINNKTIETKKFTRQIGMTVLANYDVGQLIHNFYFWLFLFAILFTSLCLFFNYIRSQKQTTAAIEYWKFLDFFSATSVSVVCLYGLTYYFKDISVANSNFAMASITLQMFVYAISFLYLIIDFEKKIPIKSFAQLQLSVFVFSCYASYCLPTHTQESFFLLYLILVVFSFIFCLAYKKSKNIFFSSLYDFLTSSISFLPIIASFAIEGMYILNQRSVYISHFRRHLVFFFTIIIFFSFSYAFLCEKKKKTIKLWNSSWVYPVIIVGIVLCANQPLLQGTYAPDIFEEANSSILISDFLNFGRLPIIEHYGCHMLLNVISGIFYGLINVDFFGAIVSPYFNYFLPAFMAILLFFILKEILGNLNAFIFCVLVPYESSTMSYFIQGLLLCLAVMHYMKKESFSRATLIWLAFIWVTISRLDLGYSFLGGAIFVLSLHCLRAKKIELIKQLIGSFALSMLTAGLLCCLLCLLTGNNPIDRLHEFISISSSNNSWAYSTLGDINSIGFRWGYFFLPIAMSGCFVYALISKKHIKTIFSRETYFLLLMLGAVYFLNLPRFLVRHSFAEIVASLTVGMFSAWIFLPLFMTYITNNKKIFAPSFCTLLFLSYALFLGNTELLPFGFASRFVSTNKYIRPPAPQKINRVILSEQSKEPYQKLDYIFNLILSPNESFIDFTCSTFIYSALNRECPVYIAQSPSMLSGEFSQEQFIKQIKEKKDKLPLALFPTTRFRLTQSVDGVPLVLRHYKVSEYLYQNYRPFIKCGKYALWVVNERYDECKKRIMAQKNLDAKILSDVSKLGWHNCRLKSLKNGSALCVESTSGDPFITNFHTLFDSNLIQEDETNIDVIIDYENSNPGTVQLFYKKGNNDYSEENSIRKHVDFSGKIVFSIKINNDTNLRFDIPDNSCFEIKEIQIRNENKSLYLFNNFGIKVFDRDIDVINYGYDDKVTPFHTYGEVNLPYLWANKDIKKAKNNKILREISLNDKISSNELLNLPDLSSAEKTKGNYILLRILSDNDSTVNMGFGNNINNDFMLKFNITFNVKAGEHDYILRPSIDYYWYTNKINSMTFSGGNNSNGLSPVRIAILEGD